jgi:hypothetical protein
MSEFLCKNGHLVSPGQLCDECGGGVYTMDGMTEAHLRAAEKECWDFEDFDEED